MLRSSFCVSVLLSFVLACGGDDEPFQFADAGWDQGRAEDATEDAPDADDTADAAAPVALTLNDVSVLFPLPPAGSDQDHLLLGPTDAGERGMLLPESVHAAVPTFPVVTEDTLSYEYLRVVAVRFDGCNDSGDGCKAQLRMVMQPLNIRTEARDSALHLFYSLEQDEFATLVDELRALRAFAGDTDLSGALRVHPVLSERGLDGEFATALKTLLLRYAGEENLTRFTFFLRAPPIQEVWFFGGFDRVGDDVTEMNIVGIPEGVQRVIRTEVTGGYAYDLTPAALEPEDGSVLFTSAAANAATDEERQAAFGSYMRVENPRIHPVDDLPCAQCHISTFVAASARSAFAFEDSAFPDDVFTSEHDLTLSGNAATMPSSLRAFGYFEREPVIAQRTVNETAAVLEDIEERFPQ